MKRFLMLAIGLLTSGAVVLGLTTAASAASAVPRPNSPTPACEAQFGIFCQEPVVAQSVPASADLIPSENAAMTAGGFFAGAPVNSSLDNDLQDGTQDWAFAQIATVPHPGGGPGAYGFTGFDRHNYGGDGVYIIEFTPFGYDGLDLCDQVHLGKIVLASCDGGADQAFIIHHGYAPLLLPAPGPYVRALSVLQVLNAQHHLCLTAPHVLLGAQLTVARCTNVAIGHGSPQFWTSIT